MPGKVTLTITTGPKVGAEFVFEEHDTLLLGRKNDCRVCLPEDPLISRHHFILEVNPPDVRLRDLGSLHGTYINGQRYGGREKHETPEEGTRRTLAQVDLHDGDEVKAGQTTLRVCVEVAARVLKSVRCLLCREMFTVEAGECGQNDNICPGCQMSRQDDSGTFSVSLSQHSRSLTQEGPNLPDYQKIEELGRGGMGVVWLAEHIQDGKQVAIKFMASKVAVDERSRRKFQREMEATCSLRHQNIITFIDSGTQFGVFYFLMEYCEGGNVASLMERRGGRLTLEEAGPIMLQTLQGLAFAHKRGFVHRDVKPQNILLCGKEGRWSVRLSDLGLAKNFEQAGFSGLSVTGENGGSLPFMPREQVTDFKYLNPVSDVWAMGATCYYILTGSFPRNHLDVPNQVEVILQGKVVPIRTRDPRIPQPVAEVIDRALADKVSERYHHAGEMYEALKKALPTWGKVMDP